MTDFAHLESQKLISRKIWVIEKLWNIHTVHGKWWIFVNLMKKIDLEWKKLVWKYFKKCIWEKMIKIFWIVFSELQSFNFRLKFFIKSILTIKISSTFHQYQLFVYNFRFVPNFIQIQITSYLRRSQKRSNSSKKIVRFVVFTFKKIIFFITIIHFIYLHFRYLFQQKSFVPNDQW